ncbi:uncharacterized protein LOC131846084 [Achroia grisella]|uniref:uncharacterized protein LOC131846084 n=1 Tax=Achroia grisella TaxID=688607 RepID=UPI0027D32D29|nr:uncharacterized protein LOC131846084 [Achroia grisella]
MTRGCVQGSACGPTMWNIILDELLQTELPEGCHIQAFADDVLMIVTASDVSTLESRTNTALKTATQWGAGVKLTFGPNKTQLIAFTPKAKTADILMDGTVLKFTKEIKLLGVILDEKLLFRSHVRYITEKAMRIFQRLCLYVRPTWGAHSGNVSIIYHGVIEPIITYAAGIWGHAAKKKCNRKTLERAQRGFALRTIKGFRTVSTTAALALAQFTPLDLKVLEVANVERTRLLGTTDLLPEDIELEKQTPVHQLLHPATRISIPLLLADSQEKADTFIKIDTIAIFTDGSKRETGEVGAAFICCDPEATVPVIKKKFKLHSSCSVYQAELFAICRACEWAVAHKYPHTVIYTDSLSSIKSIQNRSNTHPIASRIHHVLQQSLHPIEFVWVKNHVGIAGNEAADVAAGGASRLHKAPEYAKFPLTYAKTLYKKDARISWQNRYISAEQGAHTRKLLPRLEELLRESSGLYRWWGLKETVVS